MAAKSPLHKPLKASGVGHSYPPPHLLFILFKAMQITINIPDGETLTPEQLQQIIRTAQLAQSNPGSQDRKSPGRKGKIRRAIVR